MSALVAKKKLIDTKTWVIIGLGGVAVAGGLILASQWKHAALGRQVRRNVVRFLRDSGAVVHSGVVSGGVVRQPMKVDGAVNATIVQLLNLKADEMANGGGVARQDPAAEDSYQTYAQSPPPPARKPSRAPVTPRTPRTPTARKTGKRGAPPASPLEISKQFQDDGGYGDAARSGTSRSGASFEYNADDIIPQHGAHKPSEKMIFSDDEGDAPAAVIDNEDESDYE